MRHPRTACASQARGRDPVWLLACLLALATGMSLLALGSQVTMTSGGAPANDAGSIARVRGFYDAVNYTLRSGDQAGLTALLPAGFVAHGGPPGLPPTRAGLVAHLLALRATFPLLRLEPRDIAADGEIVVVRVRLDGATVGAFLGLPLNSELAGWGTVDIFRLSANAIAEHWGGRAATPLLQPLQMAPLDLPSSAQRVVTLSRTAIDPEVPDAAVVIDASLDPEALFLESGRLSVMVDEAAVDAQWWPAWSIAGATQPAPVPPHSPVVLAPGELLIVALGSRVTIHNHGDLPAVVLRVAIQATGDRTSRQDQDYPDGWEPGIELPSDPPGVTTSDLAGRLPLTLPAAQATLGLGRAVLAVGSALPIAAPGTALLAIETGRLELSHTKGRVWSPRGAFISAIDGDRGAGDAVVFHSGAAGVARSSGEIPLVLLVVTLTTEDPPELRNPASALAP